VIEAYRAVFPDIIIGAVEPTRFPSYPNWQADLYQWLVGLKRITGKPLALMQLDIPWSDDGKKVPGAESVSHEPADAITVYRQLEAFEGQAVLDGIGIIHDGTPLDTTDVAWIDDAKMHVRELEQFQGLRPRPGFIPDLDAASLSRIARERSDHPHQLGGFVRQRASGAVAISAQSSEAIIEDAVIPNEKLATISNRLLSCVLGRNSVTDEDFGNILLSSPGIATGVYPQLNRRTKAGEPYPKKLRRQT
jgi:hypothetical protein